MTLAPHITNSKPQTTRVKNWYRGATEKHANADSFQKSRDRDVDPNWMTSYLEARLERTPGCDGGDQNDHGIDDDLDPWSEEAEEWSNLLSPTIQEQLRSELGFQTNGRRARVNSANLCPCESQLPEGYDDAMNHRAPGFNFDYLDDESIGCGHRTPRRFPDADVAIEFYLE